MRKGLLRDERGVEPLAMKLMAGIILLVVGLGIGYTLYTWAGGRVFSFQIGGVPGSFTVGIPNSGENSQPISNISVNGLYDGQVALTVTEAPDHVTASFGSPSNGIPPFGPTTLEIRVENTATAGSYELVIKATAEDGTVVTETLTLTLTAPTD